MDQNGWEHVADDVFVRTVFFEPPEGDGVPSRSRRLTVGFDPGGDKPVSASVDGYSFGI